MSVRLIEEPEYRLAGAEEAVRLMVAWVEQILQSHEPLARELASKASAAYARLQALTETIGIGKGSVSLDDT